MALYSGMLLHPPCMLLCGFHAIYVNYGDFGCIWMLLCGFHAIYVNYGEFGCIGPAELNLDELEPNLNRKNQMVGHTPRAMPSA
jgi:hypothetical protein